MIYISTNYDCNKYYKKKTNTNQKNTYNCYFCTKVYENDL